MWKVINKYTNKNIDTIYFKTSAKRNFEGYVTEINDFKNTKVQIDREQRLFCFEEDKIAYIWKIVSDIEDNEEFKLKQFTVETEYGTRKRVVIYNNDKMTLRDDDYKDGVRHIYGKPGSLYEEYSELITRLG